MKNFSGHFFAKKSPYHSALSPESGKPPQPGRAGLLETQNIPEYARKMESGGAIERKQG